MDSCTEPPPAGRPGERWLNIRRLAVLGPLPQWRIDRCAAKGFDGVEFGNVGGYLELGPWRIPCR